MKVLLDECVDARLASRIAGFDVCTVYDQGWGGITNGELLALAQREFDIFITVDRNLSFQQHLPNYSIAVLLLHVRSNRIGDLAELIPELVSALATAKTGAVTHVGR